jgi:uncharacterized membrane protein HdeD (DUF308 family)
MKVTKLNNYLKGILVFIAGFIFTFFPHAPSKLFYIVGVAIILYNSVLLVMEILNVLPNVMSDRITGFIVGIIIMICPKLLAFGIPCIVGIFLIVAGGNGISNAVAISKGNGGNWLGRMLVSIGMCILGIVFIFNPFGTSVVFTRIIGVLLMVVGAAMIFTVYYHTKNAPPDSVIDVNNFSVKDD